MQVPNHVQLAFSQLTLRHAEQWRVIAEDIVQAAEAHRCVAVLCIKLVFVKAHMLSRPIVAHILATYMST